MSRIEFLFVIAVLFGGAHVVRADSSPSRLATAVSAPIDAENIPLRAASAESSSHNTGPESGPKTSRTISTVVGGLAVCLGAFFLVVWVSKRHTPAGLARLPKEVVESLGRVSLSGRQQLQLIRVGRKLVLLNVTPTTAEALTEIVDPVEVDRLVGLCQQTSPNSVTASFRDVLTQYESEPAGQGFLGDMGQTDWELATQGGRKRSSRREEFNG